MTADRRFDLHHEVVVMAETEKTEKPDREAPAAPATAMRTFIPAISFLGYPDGVEAGPVDFVAGVESRLVTEDYLDLMKSKGLVAGD